MLLARPVAAEPVRIGEDHPCWVALAARSSPTLGGGAVHGRGAAAWVSTVSGLGARSTGSPVATGLAVFAGALMIVSGIGAVFEGIAAVFNDKVFASMPQYLFAFT